MMESNLNMMHKIQFNKFYPPRIWTSNVLLSFLYYLQDDVSTQSKSLDNLNEVFLVQRISYESKNDYAVNCILFNTLISCEPSIFKYIEAQPILLNQFVALHELLGSIELGNDPQLTKQAVISLNLVHNICSSFKSLGPKVINFK